jgi:RNA polymerase sigma-70 factor (ECF subfamily)
VTLESEVSILAAAAQRGDRAALDRLLSLHVRIAHTVALGNVRSWADAADVVQTAFLTAIEKLEECRDPRRFSGWLLQIVRHAGLDSLRATARANARHGELDEVTVQSPASDQLSRSETRHALLQALGALPERQRQVVLLHDLEGWKHAEIGEFLGISEVMSRQELFVGRRDLRAALESQTPSRSSA